VKSTKVSTTVILALMPAAVLMARPSVRLAVPPPGRYGIEDLWKATVNSDTVCDAWFEGFVFEETRGQVFHATTKPFPLTRGTKVYGYRDVRIDQTQTAPGYEAFVTQTGQLPFGKYRFKLLLMSIGVGDSFGFEPKPLGRPRLISPRDGDTIRTPYPQFAWTPPMPKPSGPLTYDLSLFDVLEGQTKEEAAKANTPWFVQKRGVSTSLKYPVSARPLEAEKQYAWLVTATTADGQTATSEVRAFTLSMGGSLLESKSMGDDATIVWQHKNGTNWEIWYTLFRMGTVTQPQALSTTPVNNMDPAVAYDRAGNSWCVWSHRGPGPSQHYVVVWSRSMNNQSGWSQPQPVAMPTILGSEQADPVDCL